MTPHSPHPPPPPSYLGIDGGGTRTRAWLVDADGRLLCASEGGPANRHLVGLDGVPRTLQDRFVDLWSRQDNRGLARSRLRTGRCHRSGDGTGGHPTPTAAPRHAARNP